MIAQDAGTPEAANKKDFPYPVHAYLYQCMGLSDLVHAKAFNKQSMRALQRACYQRLKTHFPQYAAKFNFQQNVNWRKELLHSYEVAYAGYSNKAKALVSAIKENKLWLIKQLIKSLEEPSLLMALLLERGHSTREITFYINNCHEGSLRNFFYQKIAKCFTLEDGTVDTAKRDSHGRTIFFWALLLNQSQQLINALIEAGSQWSEPGFIDSYTRKERNVLSVSVQAENVAAVEVCRQILLARQTISDNQIFHTIIKYCLRYGPSNTVLRYVFEQPQWLLYKASPDFEENMRSLFANISSLQFNDETIDLFEQQGITIKAYCRQSHSKKKIMCSAINNRAWRFFLWGHAQGLIAWGESAQLAVQSRNLALIESVYRSAGDDCEKKQWLVAYTLVFGLIAVIDFLDAQQFDIRTFHFDDERSLLHMLIVNDSHYTLDYLYKNGVVLFDGQLQRQTFISTALQHSAIRTLVFLVANEMIDLNAPNARGYTVLDEYVIDYSYNGNQLAETLLKLGARVSVDAEWSDKVLCQALTMDLMIVAKQMLDNGFVADSSHLMHVISGHCGDIAAKLRLLMQNGANPNMTDRYSHGNPLVNSIFSRITDEKTLIAIFKALFDRRFPQPLAVSADLIHGVVSRAQVQVLDEFIRRGLDVNAIVFRFQTALYLALKHFNDSRCNRNSYFAIIKSLVTAEARVDHIFEVDREVMTSALMMAISSHSLELVTYLVEEGKADVNMRVGNRIPLIYALEQQQWTIAQKLYQSGADVNRLDCKGRSALHVALENQAPEKLFLAMLVDYNEPECCDYLLTFACLTNRPRYVELLLEADFSPDAHMPGKKSALEAAAATSYELTKILVDAGVSIKATCQPYANPLNEAVKSGDFDRVRLLMHPYSLVVANDNDETPLFIAMLHQRLTIVFYLLNNGATLQQSNTNGRSLQQVVSISGDQNALQCFEQMEKFIGLADRPSLEVGIADTAVTLFVAQKKDKQASDSFTELDLSPRR